MKIILSLSGPEFQNSYGKNGPFVYSTQASFFYDYMWTREKDTAFITALTGMGKMVRRARWYRWKEEEEYEQLAIIFEPPMGENMDESVTVNHVEELVHERDIAAKDEGEEEEDTEGGGSEEMEESSQEEKEDDENGYSDRERMHSDFESEDDEDELLMPSLSTPNSSMFTYHSSDVWSYDSFDM
ncbi:hypothetical protein Salat_1418800 [Sesamum alatum]|uniref:Uncharacterized protein n=1 Tax=Sesamum alatum TaxID=300844 RepID=A0AAE1YAD2_9LAMI|nr:hypothetical protein Salat_1418800 [Sesamum alatum]